MNNRKRTWFAIGYECGFACAVAFTVYQLGSMAAGMGNIIGAILAVAGGPRLFSLERTA